MGVFVAGKDKNEPYDIENLANAQPLPGNDIRVKLLQLRLRDTAEELMQLCGPGSMQLVRRREHGSKVLVTNIVMQQELSDD